MTKLCKSVSVHCIPGQYTISSSRINVMQKQRHTEILLILLYSKDQ